MMTNETKCNNDSTEIDIQTPIDLAFGVGLASWFIVPRVVLNAMPHDWQQSFVDTYSELVETFDWQTECLPLAIFQVDYQGENPVVPPERFNNYRHPDKTWLKSITKKTDKSK